MLNEEQVASLIRTLVQTVGGYFIGRGWADADLVMAVSAALVTGGVTYYGSIYKRSNPQLVKTAAENPVVEAVVVKPEAVRKLPENIDGKIVVSEKPDAF